LLTGAWFHSSSLHTFRYGIPITALAWSRDGNLIASGGIDGKIHVWNILTGKKIFNPSNYGGKVTSLAWSPISSTLLASSSSDPSDSQVHIWDITKGDTENPMTYREQTGGVNGIAWSPDGKEIASVDNGGTIRIWDAVTDYDLSVYLDFLHSKFNYTDVSVVRHEVARVE
jgi:WD40 repeat protein